MVQYRRLGILVRKCVVCGKRIDRLEGVYCKECLKKHNAETKEYKRKWKENNLCFSCGKNPPEPGYVSCRACLEKYKRNSRIHRHGIDPKELKLDLIKLKQKIDDSNEN